MRKIFFQIPNSPIKLVVDNKSLVHRIAYCVKKIRFRRRGTMNCALLLWFTERRACSRENGERLSYANNPLNPEFYLFFSSLYRYSILSYFLTSSLIDTRYEFSFAFCTFRFSFFALLLNAIHYSLTTSLNFFGCSN